MTAKDGRPRTAKQESVRVVVRCRPLSEMEISQGHQSIIMMKPERGLVELKNPKELNEPSKDFTFDAIYNAGSKQQDLYDETFRELVDSVLAGFNGTIFAYGQTGTGKTYTMEGKASVVEERGVIFNCFEHIFQHISQSCNQQYLVRASYLEIYQEDIRDLLNKDAKPELKERPDVGVYIKDLSTFVTRSVEEIQGVMSVGNANRSVGRTNMNEHSSRSHAIFIITVECSETGPTGETHIRVGRLNLVDLAGSERQAKTGATGDRFKEATKINLSLSALGNVISALVDGRSTHIPYRDSKLTRLLQDSLGGNSKTVMVACIGPASYNYEETLGTLRYANRAKNIKNAPKINEDPKDALLREFQDEITRLREMLEKRKGKKGGEGARGADYLCEEKLSLAADRKALTNTKHHISEHDRKQIGEQLEERERQLEQEIEQQAQVLERIKTMESKLLGGTDLVNHTREQQTELDRRRKELAEQKKREREVLQELEREEEDSLEMHQTFSNLQQEMEAKTRKLRKFRLKLKKMELAQRDAMAGHSEERRELQGDIEAINRELKLKLLIVENFVPSDVASRVRSRASWSDEESCWRVPGTRPLSAPIRQDNLVLVEGNQVLSRSSGADSGVSCTEASTSSGLRSSSYFDKRPVSAVGLRRPMTTSERVMVERAREQLSIRRRPPVADTRVSMVEPLLDDSILRFCGENVVLFSGLERATLALKNYDPHSSIAQQDGAAMDEDVVVDAGGLRQGPVSGSSTKSRLRSPSFDTRFVCRKFLPRTAVKKRSCPQRHRARDAARIALSQSTRSRRKVARHPSIDRNNSHDYQIHIPFPIRFLPHPIPPPPDPTIAFRSFLKIRPSVLSCVSMSSSESEGICADYIGDDRGHDDDWLFSHWRPSCSGREKQQSTDDSPSGYLNNRRNFSEERSSCLRSTTSVVLSHSEMTRPTRIPRLMSHSFSHATNTSVTRSFRRSARDALLSHSRAHSLAAVGSREQLSDPRDVLSDARGLLHRSRHPQTPNRHVSYGQRCLLPPTSVHNRFSLSPRRRLLNRPQMGLSTTEVPAITMSLVRSMNKSQTSVAGGFYKRSLSERCALGRMHRSACTDCEPVMKLRRRVVHHHSGAVDKRGVVGRRLCLCREKKENVLVSDNVIISSDFVFGVLEVYNWATFIAALAFVCRMIGLLVQ